jgi:antitoxin (DNA-binding transcriptional repressor) of toxin-antitoxin stability system
MTFVSSDICLANRFGNDYSQVTGVICMPQAISKSQFKAKALEFFRAVEDTGEPVIITDRGRATLELRRYTAEENSPLERLSGSLLYYDRPMDPVGEDDWEALHDRA